MRCDFYTNKQSTYLYWLSATRTAVNSTTMQHSFFHRVFSVSLLYLHLSSFPSMSHPFFLHLSYNFPPYFLHCSSEFSPCLLFHLSIMSLNFSSMSLNCFQVCELNFTPENLQRESTFFDEATGRRLTAKLNILRL